MGMRRMWVFDCDGPTCGRRLLLGDENERDARLEALDKGWETVLTDDGQIAPMRTAWFCPVHRFIGLAETVPPAEHEEWCPLRTRHGACQCRVMRSGPRMHDEAYGGTGKTGKKVEVVILPEDIL